MSVEPLQHTLLVRTTHWINALTFFALVISGIAILIAHPRFYWGEAGGYGSPAWIELPLPINLDQSGWGRSLHFLAAWACLLNGLVYVLSGVLSRHFRSAFLTLKHPTSEAETQPYSSSQRLAYIGVIFILFPLAIATGIAMSPAVTSVLPLIVEFFGGYQSSRTVHFFVANFLVLFLAIHVVMVFRAGFRSRMRTMLYGRSASRTAER